jgi:hypothetical protein
VSELFVADLIVSELVVSEILFQVVMRLEPVVSICETVIGKVAGIADCMIVTKVVAGETISVDGMARKSMCAKSVSGETVRAKGVTHMDRTMGSEAMEAVEATPAKRRMKAPAKSMEPPASPKSMKPAPAAKSVATTSKCINFRRDAERADRNARRQNTYCPFADSAILTHSCKTVGVGGSTTARTLSPLTSTNFLHREFPESAVPQ